MKKQLILGVIFVLSTLIVVGVFAGETRTWTSGKHHTTAEFEGVTPDGKSVILKRSNVSITVDLDKLSETDREWVASHSSVDDDSSSETSNPFAGLDAVARRGLEVVPTNCVRRAFLVGVDDYAEFADLKFAVADVELIAEKLRLLGFEDENIVVLKSGDDASLAPTKKNIERAFKHFLASAGPDDMLFVDFSGHGFVCSDFTGFAPQDAVADPATTLDPSSGISLSDVVEQLKESSAKFKWVVIDACREKISSTRSVLRKNAYKPLEAPTGMIVLQSCGEGEFSHEDAKLGHGVFTAKLSDALDGKADTDADGVITVMDVVKYATEKTRQSSPASSPQTPYCRGDFTDFVLAEGIDDSWGDSTNRTTTKRQTFKVAGVEYGLCWCPAGTFMMGDPNSYVGQHRVTLSSGFWMQETEVTQGLWKAVMGDNPSESQGDDDLPVERVSWEDAHKFLNKLNALNVAPKGMKFALPTEAQWEYACRAGTDTTYSWGDDADSKMMNYDRNVAQTSPVKNYEPNAWGLYDMHGNVCEWCEDRYGDYPKIDVTDPTGLRTGSNRVFRGGGWCDSAQYCRAANRDSSGPSLRNGSLGFRVACVAEQ